MLAQMIFGTITKGFVAALASGPSNPNGPDGPIALEMDVVTSETFFLTATPTRSLVESGANVTDHVALEPEKLSINAIVSNTPLGWGKLGTKFSNPAKQAREYLEAAYNTRQPFDFVGGLKVYKSRVITSLNFPRTAQTGMALEFSCTMESIRIVSSKLVPQSKISSDSEASASPSVEKGDQPAVTASDRGSSTMLKVVKFLDPTSSFVQ